MTGKILKFDIPEGTRGVPCRSCAETIYFIPREKDPSKKHPVNVDGQSHFSTCSEAEAWRKRK
jgi:hypothetical protein